MVCKIKKSDKNTKEQVLEQRRNILCIIFILLSFHEEPVKVSMNYIFYELEGAGHGPWNFLYEDNQLEELALSFIVDQQELIIN